MKYKDIDSALHNFGHSFLSGMNYFEDNHVMYDIFYIARKMKGKAYSINFSTGDYNPDQETNSRIKTSISYYSSVLPEHLKSHKLDPESLSDVTLLVKSSKNLVEAYMNAVDDKGYKHHVRVNLG